MADVFLSYVRADRDVAEAIARRLEGADYSVWWDRYIQAGADFSAEIERELAAAPAVVVLWSTASHDSKWVRDEAAYARDRNKLIPIRLDSGEPPLGFRQVQSLDFGRTVGEGASEAFEMLVDSLRRLVRDDRTHTVPLPRSLPTRPGRTSDRTRLLWSAAVAVAAAVGAILWSTIPRIGHTVDALQSGRTLIGDFELATDDGESVRFAKGLTDTIGRTFATVGLESMGRADANQTSPAGAEFVLRGTIDRRDEKVVLSADIVHTRDGVVLWSVQGERDVAESRWLQERVALELAGVVGFALRARRFAGGDESSELMSDLMRLYRADDVAQATEMSLRIRDAFPQYALSHGTCALQHAMATIARRELNTPQELARMREITLECARTALSLDPRIGAAYVALAVVEDPSATWLQREGLLQKAIEVQPGSLYSVRFYYELLRSVGRIREARLMLDRIPLDQILDIRDLRLIRAYVAIRLASPNWQAAEIEVAREEFAHIARIWPEGNANVWWFEAEHWYGDPKIAARLAKEDSRVRAMPVWAGKNSGRCLDMFLDARIRRVDLVEADIDAGCVEGFHLAPESIHGYFGHSDAAYRDVEKHFPSYARNSFSSWRGNLFEPYMRVVRADTRFMPLAARLGLVDYWLEADQWPDFCTTEELPYDCKTAALAAKQAQPYQSKSSGT